MMKRSFSILGAFVSIIIVLLVVRAVTTGTMKRPAQTLPTATLTVGAATFTVEVADEPSEQAQGLSGRAALAPDAGMLFVFPEAGSYTFWMKNMRFPLDFVWIAGDRVVGVTENAPPEGNNPALTYGPPEAVDKVLEINAGDVTKYHITSGDLVTLQ